MQDFEYLQKSVRWQMRRGLLELDILLSRFIASGEFEKLTHKELLILEEILQWPDQDFLQIMHSIQSVDHIEQNALIKKIKVYSNITIK